MSKQKTETNRKTMVGVYLTASQLAFTDEQKKRGNLPDRGTLIRGLLELAMENTPLFEKAVQRGQK